MNKASRLIYSFLAYFRYIQRTGFALLQAILGTRRFTFLCTYSPYVQWAFQAALKAASHHSDTLVCFCVHCHSISNIGELPDISIHIAMFATLHLPTSAYPLLQLDWNTLRTPRVQSVKWLLWSRGNRTRNRVDSERCVHQSSCRH